MSLIKNLKKVIDKEIENKEEFIFEKINDNLIEVSSPQIYQAQWKAYFWWCNDSIKLNRLFRISAQEYLDGLCKNLMTNKK